MTSAGARPRISRLSIHLALASAVSIAAVALVCGLGLVSLRRLSGMTSQALAGQIALANDASAFEELLFQKGFVAEYMLTRDRGWLEQLAQSRRSFAAWLVRAQAGDKSAEARQFLDRIAAEYADYDEARARIIALFDGGHAEEAHGLFLRNHSRIEQLLMLCQEFGQLSRAQARHTMAFAQRSLRELTFMLLLASLAGAGASLLVGYLLARSIKRPIYELQLRVESAVQRTRLTVPPGREGLDALGEHVGALLRKLEETDAVVLDHRRRLIQSEKLSAVGELSAKLAHEILNPLSGMKAAVQLMDRQAADLTGVEIRETTAALGKEIGRVEQLVRRLVDYARPLAPRIEVCPVLRLLDAAVEAAQPELERARVALSRHEEPGLPPLEIDVLLMTQAVVNLLANAAQSMSAARREGTIELLAIKAPYLGREHVCIRVSDQGPGILPEHLPRLFHPFFTTRAGGHGLGLAVTQNIVMEHGGHLQTRNRDDGPGAVFEILVPLVR